MVKPTKWLVPALLSALGGLGCFPAPLPMRAAHIDHRPAGRARCLLVFLPGIGDSADSFEDEGFARTVRASGLAIDVAASDATLGYYTRSLMPKQLHSDVIAPARARGHYTTTWLVGVSFGGFGTLMTARDYAGEIDGAFAIAPYLGRDEVLDPIRAAGGLHAWSAPPFAKTNSENYDWQLWRFLQAATSGREKAPQLYLGWGKDDGLGPADQLLAAALPEQNVYSAPGGHDWKTWNGLLAQFLKRGPMQKACRP